MRLTLLCCTWREECMGEEGSELPVCASCDQRIYDGQYLQALNADWHADCFRLDTVLSLSGDSMTSLNQKTGDSQLQDISRNAPYSPGTQLTLEGKEQNCPLSPYDHIRMGIKHGY